MPEYFQFDENFKMGIKDGSGKVVIQPLYDFVSPFSDGFFMVTKEGKHGFVDEKGREPFPLTDSVECYRDFSEGLAGFRKNGKYGFVDRTGKAVIPEQFEFAELFHEGLAAVRNERDLHGFIDKAGRVVIPFQYPAVTGFRKGYAMFGDFKTFGLMDKEGKVAVEQKYIFIGPVEDGKCLVRVREKGLFREGFLTLGGEVEWNNRMDGLNAFHAASKKLGEEYKVLLDGYFAAGCPCRFPRFRDLLHWTSDDKNLDMELLFDNLRPRLTALPQTGKDPAGLETSLFACPKCATTYRQTWREFNAFYAVINLVIDELKAPGDLGPNTQKPIPLALGLTGLVDYFKPENYKRDYVKTDVPTAVDYLKAGNGYPKPGNPR
jgi:hypothetical protein